MATAVEQEREYLKRKRSQLEDWEADLEADADFMRQEWRKVREWRVGLAVWTIINIVVTVWYFIAVVFNDPTV